MHSESQFTQGPVGRCQPPSCCILQLENRLPLRNVTRECTGLQQGTSFFRLSRFLSIFLSCSMLNNYNVMQLCCKIHPKSTVVRLWPVLALVVELHNLPVAARELIIECTTRLPCFERFFQNSSKTGSHYSENRLQTTPLRFSTDQFRSSLQGIFTLPCIMVFIFTVRISRQC